MTQFVLTRWSVAGGAPIDASVMLAAATMRACRREAGAVEARAWVAAIDQVGHPIWTYVDDLTETAWRVTMLESGE